MSNCPRLTSAAPTNVDAADRVSCRPSRAIENTFGRSAVGCPACVADTIGAVERVHANRVFQIAQLSRRTSNRQMIVTIEDRNTCGIIPTVFKPAQAIQDDGDCSSVPDIADNATHILRIQGMREGYRMSLKM